MAEKPLKGTDGSFQDARLAEWAAYIVQHTTQQTEGTISCRYTYVVGEGVQYVSVKLSRANPAAGKEAAAETTVCLAYFPWGCAIFR